MLSFEPCPMAIMMITAATPMMIPNIERKERILLLATAFRLTLNRFSIFILTIHYSLFTIHFLIIVLYGQFGQSLSSRLDVRIDSVLTNLAIAQIDIAAGVFGDLRVVGHKDNRVTLLV